MIRFAGMFLVLALSVVSAETYTLEIYQPVLLGGKQLKSGEYKLDVQGSNMTLKKGKLLAAESKVKVETLEQKARAVEPRETLKHGRPNSSKSFANRC